VAESTNGREPGTVAAAGGEASAPAALAGDEIDPRLVEFFAVDKTPADDYRPRRRKT